MGASNEYLMKRFDAVKGELHVLIVDDMADIRDLTEMFVQGMGVSHTHKAADGAEALTVMGHDTIDVVLTDLSMPGMNGMDLVRNIRASDAFHDIPVIMISGDKGVEELAIQRGVTQFLAKPFDMEELEHAIARASVNPPGAAPS